MPGAWQEEKCVYWNVLVGLKYVRLSETLPGANVWKTMWNSVWNSGNSHVFHTYFTWNSTCLWKFAMWKVCENNVKKGVKNVILFTQCFTCSVRQVHTPNMWNAVWNGSYFHAVFIRFSHDNFTCMWNFTMWKACEKNVHDVKKLPFHTVFHMLCQRTKVGKLLLS